ncbi:MAG TPA: asparagine synthase B [Candidatus Marinimicrobia bacterium]|nr:asparagine synthase B [Candidatus Neomarinimicrobiota bacterium]
MCGILGVLDIKTDKVKLRRQALAQSKLQRHRGPDWSGIYVGKNAILAHERLAIVGVESGAQPILNASRTIALAVNGEIYNHAELETRINCGYQFQTKSDCEVILALYQQEGTDFLNELRGMFAFILYDDERQTYLIARDHIGIIPLYTGFDEDGNFYVASEMKAIYHVCQSIAIFPPGHYLTSAMKEPSCYYRPSWMDYSNVANNKTDSQLLKEALEHSIKIHLMSDVPYAVLLSGGLDSSLIAAIVKKFAAKRVEDQDRSEAWWPRLHSFAIGVAGAPDLIAAREVANYIGTVHHELHFTIQEGLDALSDVIYHLETFDTTTVRASTPMYLMARKIKAMGIKMVLSGEGSDEIFGGYLYFHKAPNPQEFHEETVRKITRLHLYDCLRANKSMAAWGVEARVPYLDYDFLEVAMNLNPIDKMCLDGRIEKHILRTTFHGYLPDRILWRQKEQFSDGVGYSWIDSLKTFAEHEISDQKLATAKYKFPEKTPQTKEEYLYRQIFESHFPSQAALDTVPFEPSIACSTATALRWDQAFKTMADPSGRAVRSIHKDSY